MKKGVTFLEALTLVLMVWKLANWSTYTPPSWFAVFLPLIFEAFLLVLQETGLWDRVKFQAWRFALKIRILGAQREAHKMMGREYERGLKSRTPGNDIKTQKTGLQ